MLARASAFSRKGALASGGREGPVKSLTRVVDTWARVRPLDGQRPALFVLLLGLLATGLSFWAVRRNEADLRRAEFEQRARDLGGALRASLELPLETLRLMPSLFDGSDPVDHDEFLGLVGPSLARHHGIAYLEWAAEVLDEDRDTFEQKARALGFPGFFIGDPGPNGALRPSPRRPRHLALLYVAPDSPAVIGLDLSFEAKRRELALRALSENMLTVSPQFRLVEDPPEVRSIAVYAPLMRPRHPSTDTRGPRRGLAILIFRIGPLVREVFGKRLAQMDVVVLDETTLRSSAEGASPSPAALSEVLFESRPGLATRRDDEFETAYTLAFEFHTRRWKMRFLARPGSGQKGLLSPVIGSFGALLSIAAMLVAGMLHLAGRLRGEVQAAKQIGQYKLIRKLGEGGMGIVYEAEHALLRRPTALKVISPRAVGQAAISRFEREVKATSQLTHPNTVAVYDYGRAPRGVFYYAMEYLPGANLEQMVKATGPLPASRVVHLLRQACASLAEAHAAGLVHRDIKPANVMVCERGGIHDFVKVLDFGLVKDNRKASEAASMAGSIVGTPHYMAPEIVLGRGASASTDLYALGAVGYFMLTGHEVFPDSTLLGVIAHHMSDPPPPPSARLGKPIRPDLEALILRCLAKTAQGRPSSADELRELLRACDVPRWTQPEARRYWIESRAAVLAVTRAEPGAHATPWGDTLVVDLKDRGGSFESLREPALEPEQAPARDADGRG
jgi:CHASE1-domain containing sensor protein